MILICVCCDGPVEGPVYLPTRGPFCSVRCINLHDNPPTKRKPHPGNPGWWVRGGAATGFGEGVFNGPWGRP